MLWIVILICAAALIIALLHIPFYMDIEYGRNILGTGFKIDVSVLGISFTVAPKPKRAKKPEKENRKKKKEGKEDKPLSDRFTDSFDSVLTIFESLKDDIADILDYAAERLIKIKLIDFELKFGLGDAAATGVMTGAVNTLTYNALGFVHRHMSINRWNISIEPDFNREYLDVSVKCIIKAKAANAIVVLIKAALLFNKLKKTGKHRAGK